METSCTKLAVTCFGAGGALFVSWWRPAKKGGSQRMLFQHERNSGLGMDALVTVCSRNMNGIMVWAWMLWSACALPTRTEFWFGHGCSGHRICAWNTNGILVWVIVCSWNTKRIMVWAWMLRSPYALGT